MDDYISREEAKRVLKYLLNDSTVECACKLIDIVPAADVEPVRHGRWEVHEESDECYGYIRWLECSLCHESIGVSARLRYCPSCGAKMDLEGENNDD